MGEISNGKEIDKMKNPESNGIREIKPESNISLEDARSFFDNLFERLGEMEIGEKDNPEEDLEKVLRDYFRDLKVKSECPNTISNKPFETSDLKKRTPEENAEMREEFSDNKAQLKREWEEANGISWPKYEHDVYSASGKLIRKAGSDYDAHHIQPLGMGGKNEVSNITPLNAGVHYDKQGVHAQDSPYSKLDQILGGME